MSDRQTVIRLDEVSLCYRLAKQRIGSIKAFAIAWLKGSLTYEALWALKELSLTIRAGERVGVVGKNGAGKSTLLSVIAGVLKATRGRVIVRGRVAPILELGTGFDHELTGVENIYLNALLLGHRRREIDAEVEKIIAFSELGEFVHSPIRSYSSGMMARLGFAIATAWIPDILLLDEIFAVGDAGFLRRSEDRLAELKAQATATVLVSHSEEVIRKNCDRCLWLAGGRLVADGPVEDVLARYAAEP
ncbi:MAG: ABC transporter ATP-binding protein [Acidobacteriota bacterium]